MNASIIPDVIVSKIEACDIFELSYGLCSRISDMIFLQIQLNQTLE